MDDGGIVRCGDTVERELRLEKVIGTTTTSVNGFDCLPPPVRCFAYTAGAARYFRMAAYEGNPVAANRLARLYAAGRGVRKDGVEAARWHLLARAAGVADPWLDGVLANLAPADKAKVEDQLHQTLAN